MLARLQPWLGWLLLGVGLVGGFFLARQHVLDPPELEKRASRLAREERQALDWVRLQLVPGETCLSSLSPALLPAPDLSPALSRAFWETGKVDLLPSNVRFVVYDEARVSARFARGLDPAWTRSGPRFGSLRALEVLAIPRAGAVSQPPFRSSVKLPAGPCQAGQIIEIRLEIFNATYESRRLGWVEVEVGQETFPRLAGYNPLPARTGEMVSLLAVAPDRPGRYEVTVRMPRTASGEPYLLKKGTLEVKSAGAP